MQISKKMKTLPSFHGESKLSIQWMMIIKGAQGVIYPKDSLPLLRMVQMEKTTTRKEYVKKVVLLSLESYPLQPTLALAP